MTKSELFKKAHQLTKQMIQAGERYRAVFSRILRDLYQQSKEFAMTQISQFEQALEKFIEATGDAIYDPFWDKSAPWMVDAVETQETLEQFIESSHQWNERSGYQRGDINGVPFIYWSRVQINKGDSRRELSLVDFGDRRIALDFNATDY